MNAISASPEGDDASGANEQPSEALPVQDGRFKPGRSGNPKGPAAEGRRCPTTLWIRPWAMR